jgi:hypothetical protein
MAEDPSLPLKCFVGKRAWIRLGVLDNWLESLVELDLEHGLHVKMPQHIFSH